jgi:F0F1-type ATP synthase assembly protein I
MKTVALKVFLPTAAIILGLYLGLLIDKISVKPPLFTVTFLMIGIVAGASGIYFKKTNQN